MVARIRTGKSLKGAIYYNEHKVKEGKAEFIMAHGYGKDLHQLHFKDKLGRLQKLTSLNERAVTNCLHVSLNFDPSEKIGKETLQKIASTYMDKIGFGGQPFLVYEHSDAGHQHIHIVSTNIQKDGKRISFHNLGKTKSEVARKEIEMQFDLVRASGKRQKVDLDLKVSPERALYGKTETKRAISNIVTSVINQYSFASFYEFNAALQQFGVIADRGAEGTRMFQNKGLQYSLLDSNSNKIGVPIKASSIYGKPTLSLLESKYQKSENHLKERVKTVIDAVISQSQTRTTFAAALNKQQIGVVFRSNDQGFLYGITYVDHQTKCIFNGSDLGKSYSAGAIREKFESVQEKDKNVTERNMDVEKKNWQPVQRNSFDPKTSEADILNAIIDPVKELSYLPWQLKKKRKKKNKNLGI